MKKNYNLPCNIAETLNIIGDKWTLLIVRDLISGISKFSDLKQSLKGIAPNILSDRLKILEEEEIIKSVPYSKHPPRFEYELNQKGKDLSHILNTIAIWGNKHLSDKYYEVIATDCKHEVEVTYHCSVCEKTTSDIKFKSIKNNH